MSINEKYTDVTWPFKLVDKMDKKYPTRFAYRKSTIFSPHIQGKNKTHGFLLHIAWCKTFCGTWLIENIREYIGLYARADPLVPSCHIHLPHPFLPIRSQHKSLQEYLQQMLDFFDMHLKLHSIKYMPLIKPYNITKYFHYCVEWKNTPKYD